MSGANNNDLNLADQLNEFLFKNRKFILILTAVILTSLAVLAVFISVSANMKKNALYSVEKLISELEQFKEDYNKENSENLKKEKVDSGEKIDFSEDENKSVSEHDENKSETKIDEKIAEKEDNIIKELELICMKSPNSYAAFRGNSFIGDIYFSRKDYNTAITKYQKAAEALPKKYTAGVSYFNAASCADELGDNEKALDFYKKAVASEAFPLKARALFNIGRIHEALNNHKDAIDVFENLLKDYPDSDLSLIGKSRIIKLQNN